MNLVVQGAVVVGVVLMSLGSLWLARRSPWNARFSEEVGEHNKAFDFLGTAFAVLLAFVVLEAYESYNDAKSGAEEEAESVLQLSRTVEAFGPEEHARLEGLLVCYGRAVIHHGWPAMEKEEASPVVNNWGTRFREGALRVDIDSRIEGASFRQLLTEQDDRIEGRRTRLAEAVRVVPLPLWLVLLLGAALTIGWVILSAGRQGSFLVQAAVVASVAAMVTSALLLVHFLDHPFADESGSITPIEMEHTLETIAHEEEDQGVEVTPPCTQEGGFAGSRHAEVPPRYRIERISAKVPARFRAPAMSLTTTAEPSGRRAFAFSKADATDSETVADTSTRPSALS